MTKLSLTVLVAALLVNAPVLGSGTYYPGAEHASVQQLSSVPINRRIWDSDHDGDGTVWDSFPGRVGTSQPSPASVDPSQKLAYLQQSNAPINRPGRDSLYQGPVDRGGAAPYSSPRTVSLFLLPFGGVSESGDDDTRLSSYQGPVEREPDQAVADEMSAVVRAGLDTQYDYRVRAVNGDATDVSPLGIVRLSREAYFKSASAQQNAVPKFTPINKVNVWGFNPTKKRTADQEPPHLQDTFLQMPPLSDRHRGPRDLGFRSSREYDQALTPSAREAYTQSESARRDHGSDMPDGYARMKIRTPIPGPINRPGRDSPQFIERGHDKGVRRDDG